MNEDRSLENTAEMSFKFKECTSELEMLRSEYDALKESLQKTEEDILVKQSTIESLKLALNYNSSYQVTKESDYKIRIEELEKTLKAQRQEKESLNTNFTRQIIHKDSYIENLLTTMLNLHQKIEYYKEDLTELKKNLDSQKKHLEIESMMHERTEKLYQDSLKELEKYKKSFVELKHKAVETELDSEEIFKDLKSEYEHEYVEETQKIEKNYENRVRQLSEDYTYRVNSLDTSHKEVVNSLMKFMQSRMEGLKVHYEQRIFKMIKEYSFQEAKVQSKIANLSGIICNLEDKYASLADDLVGKTSALKIVNEERKELYAQKHELDKYILSVEIENKTILSNTLAELEQTKLQLELQQKDLQHDFDHKVKLLSNENSIKIGSIKARHERKLQKILKKSEENSEKLKKFHETQCKYLLESLTRLEEEKTTMQVMLEHNVRELKKDLEITVKECDRKVFVSRKSILHEYETEKDRIVNEYKLQLHEQNKEFEVERIKIQETVENAYKKIIQNVKQQCDKEKFELFQDNLAKMDHVQTLAQKKYDHLENQLSIVKKSFYEEGEKWSKLLEDKEVTIKKLEKTLENLNLDLEREKVKVLESNHTFEELEKAYQSKIKQLTEAFNEKELKLIHQHDNDKKIALSKVYHEKMELENRLEKTVQMLNEKVDASNHRYKMLEKKKKDMFLKENQQTIQRYVNEITDRNKTIDSLNKEIARLKVQIKYVGATMKIFTDDKILTSTHRKASSDIHPGTLKRPLSSGGNRTFKF